MAGVAAGAATAARITWREATVVELIDETPSARTLVLDVPDWPGHDAGQHVDVRLTAEDGYQAQRSYSIATPWIPSPPTQRIELTVEVLPDGEVSGYLGEELREGDELELRGPIGGWFAWGPEDGGPLLLVAGGSGVAPLMAMLRHRAASGEAGYAVSACLLLSSRSVANVIYREELQRLGSAPDGPKVVHTLTREQPPPGWRGYARRIDAPMLAEVGFQPAAAPKVFVCGPTPMVEAVAEALVGLGRSTATPRVVCCARSSRSTRRRRGRHARAAPGQRRWQSCASTPSSWAPSCAAPLAMRPWYGSPARRGGSGSTCGVRQPSWRCPLEHDHQESSRAICERPHGTLPPLIAVQS